MSAIETYRADGTLVEYVDATGHHYLDGGSWRVEPLTVVEQAAVAAYEYGQAHPPGPPLDTRVATVESKVADIDAIIVAVLT